MHGEHQQTEKHLIERFTTTRSRPAKRSERNHSSAGASKNKFVEMEKNVNRMNRSEMMVRKEKQMVEGAAFARPAEIY